MISISVSPGYVTSSGSGYTAGTYSNVAFTTTGNGTGATATLTIPGFAGVITNGGSGYTDNALVSAEFRNPPTTTYTVTVVQRGKLTLSSITGTVAVGATVTGSTSGATATVTAVPADFSYVYINNVSGTFLDAQQDNITAAGGFTATVDTVDTSVNRYLINGNEAANIALVDDNTYRFDTSDSVLLTTHLLWVLHKQA